MAQDLATLQKEIDLLEGQKVELQPQEGTLRQETERLQELIDAVGRGVLFGVPKWKIALVVLLPAIGVAGAWVAMGRGSHQAEEQVRVLKITRTLQPRLLITSKPAGARVVLDHEAGVVTTPLLRALSRFDKRRFSVILSAPGYAKTERFVEVTPTRGAHLHVVLEKEQPRPASPHSRVRNGRFRGVKVLRGR